LLDARDAVVERTRARPMTGDELRTAIADIWRVPYSRAAGWLALSIDGLHKQMRGDRAVSLPTRLLFNQINFDFRVEALAWTAEERQHPDSKVYRSKLRRVASREQRKPA